MIGLPGSIDETRMLLYNKEKGKEMKHRWQISKDGEKGKIVYDEESQSVDVDFPVPSVLLDVQNHLTKEQTVMYPIGSGLDQDEPKQELPTKSLSNMRMILSGLIGAVGVKVGRWESFE